MANFEAKVCVADSVGERSEKTFEVQGDTHRCAWDSVYDCVDEFLDPGESFLGVLSVKFVDAPEEEL